MLKNVLLIIAFQGFRDEEYEKPKEVLAAAGISTTTASTQVGTATGKLGLKAQVDISFDQVNVANYDAVAFIGGPGSYDFFEDSVAQNIAQETIKQNKILAAICAAPGILAHAGLLKGVMATCFPAVADLIKAKGANYTGAGVEIDNKIITADGPGNARRFGSAIAKLTKLG